MVLSLTSRNAEPDIVVLELTGRVTLGRESSQIEALVVKQLKDGVRKMVIDLSKVDYIDSSGIGIIAYSFSKITQAGAKCRVAGANGMVMDLFRVTRLESVIQFFPTAHLACESLAEPAGAQQA